MRAGNLPSCSHLQRVQRLLSILSMGCPFAALVQQIAIYNDETVVMVINKGLL
jgi:hypothetical protein